MQDSNLLPKVDCSFDNELHKIEKILDIYSIAKEKNLRGFEKLVLKYYLRNGFSSETQQMVAKDTVKRAEYIHTINTSLREKGFLVKNKYKETELSTDMEMLRNLFVKGNKKLYIVNFNG